MPLIDKICLNCGCVFTSFDWRNKSYCKRVCYKNHTDKKGGYKKGGPTLIEKWIEKYGEEKTKELQLIKNKKISSIHSASVSLMTQEEKRNKFTSKTKQHTSQKERMIKKYGNDDGILRYAKSLERLAAAGTGKKFTSEQRQNIRLGRIKGIESRIKSKLSPRYNPSACKFIDEFGYSLGFNFHHAEHKGGEVYLPIGFYLDGYDKSNNTVIEYYERHHYNKVTGQLKERDLNRECEIIKYLGCQFIRVNAFDVNNILIQKVA